jgi:hypothetical protein
LRKYLLLGTLWAVAATAPARGATVWFTDRASWEAAVSVNTNVDFSGLASSGSTLAIFNPWSITVSDVTFSTFGFQQLYVVDSAFDSARYDWGSGAVLQGPGGGAHSESGLDITFAGSYAAGLDFMAASGTAPELSAFSFLLSNGDFQGLNSAAFPNRAFVGFISDTKITSIRVANEGTTVLLDNVALATSSAPEPSTLLYALPGLALIAAGRRRRR